MRSRRIGTGEVSAVGLGASPLSVEGRGAAAAELTLTTEEFALLEAG
ncbi:hypothetical protein GCM10010193_29870 [Kitasatospora atroaurantiaca]|uniref:Uncharacterized protein n=1 Tax=Kitasatospora atroaurantiaca TaxID=285545 RepID=A0A561EQV0_9ACTN|nr:hypothetical protein [Kitasatospora atroaurantiaca]TWE17975.1 hypothetical protein FB465_3022 [Kitasatospora atroaurantiaca]